MARKNFNTTVDEGTIEKITKLAVNGRSKGEIIDIAVALLETRENVSGALSEVKAQGWFQQVMERFDEIPDVLRSIIEEMRAKRAGNSGASGEKLGPGYDPAGVPGVKTGMKGLVPAGASRELREKRERAEREARALGLDKSGADREDVDRSDEFVGY